MSDPNRIFLIALGAVFLPYGLYCFFVPGFLAEAAGVAATSATGTTEIRAMYGGLQAAFGVLLLAGARGGLLAVAALAAVAFVLPGLALARALGVLVDGGLSSYTTAALLFEIGSGAIAVTLLRSRLRLLGT